jgi:hypothetical protein
VGGRARAYVTDRDVELGQIALRPPLTVERPRRVLGAARCLGPQRAGDWSGSPAVDGGMYSPPAAVPIDSEDLCSSPARCAAAITCLEAAIPLTVASVTAEGADITANALLEDRDMATW